jgi:hypothetical protein
MLALSVTVYKWGKNQDSGKTSGKSLENLETNKVSDISE